ncbi:MAG: helix-turn-helix domain-containing protein, partial [Candidatus Dormibacteraeota bacterium]|nr:helix-turn-helix domain-containing protein [Candidatus Dormibacteraeota bacterium]
FTQLVLQGAGLDNILDAIASLAQGPVGLYDPAGFRFEHGAGGGLPARRIPIPAALSSASTPIEQRGPRGRSPMTLTPVRAGAALAAVLALEGSLAQASPGRRRALEHGATVIALELLKERAAAEVERRLRGDLLEGLLADQRDPAEIRRLAIAAERLGYRIPEQAWVVVLEPDDERAALAMQGHPLQDRFQRDLERLCALVAPGSMLVVRATSLVLLVPTAPPGETGSTRNLEAMEELGRRIQALAGGLEKALSLSVGIGGRTSSPQGLHRAHEEAREALRLIHRAKQRAAVTSYRSLGAFRLLLEVRDPEVLRRFVEESLGPLLGYQESHRTPLLPTLEGLASHGWNQSATARSLRIHINTLAYRVQRIEALLGMALDDPEARVVIGVALRARSLLPD